MPTLAVLGYPLNQRLQIQDCSRLFESLCCNECTATETPSSQDTIAFCIEKIL